MVACWARVVYEFAISIIADTAAICCLRSSFAASRLKESEVLTDNTVEI